MVQFGQRIGDRTSGTRGRCAGGGGTSGTHIAESEKCRPGIRYAEFVDVRIRSDADRIQDATDRCVLQRFAAAYRGNSGGRVSELLQQHAAERKFVGNGLSS